MPVKYRSVTLAVPGVPGTTEKMLSRSVLNALFEVNGSFTASGSAFTVELE